MQKVELTQEQGRAYFRHREAGVGHEEALHRALGTAGEDAAVEAAGGGPEDPVADAMVAANTGRSIGASVARRAWRQAQSTGRAAQTSSGRAGIVGRLFLAVALGLIALEIASEATGRSWGFNLGAPWSTGNTPQPPQPYEPLTGQGYSAPQLTPGAGAAFSQSSPDYRATPAPTVAGPASF